MPKTKIPNLGKYFPITTFFTFLLILALFILGYLIARKERTKREIPRKELRLKGSQKPL